MSITHYSLYMNSLHMVKTFQNAIGLRSYPLQCTYMVEDLLGSNIASDCELSLITNLLDRKVQLFRHFFLYMWLHHYSYVPGFLWTGLQLKALPIKTLLVILCFVFASSFVGCFLLSFCSAVVFSLLCVDIKKSLPNRW